jgi:predicted amidophosphoribosyltransferase
VVSNEEIKRMLEAKRRGVNIEYDQNKPEHYKICSQCKTKNPEKAIFCVNCRCKLDKNMNIKCPSCGTENTINAKFCVGCGKKLDQQPSEPEPLEVKPKLQPAVQDENKGNDVEFSESKNKLESNNKTTETQEEPIKKPIIPSNIPEHELIQKNDSKKVCPACNGKNLKTAKFCVVCGKNFDNKQTSSDHPKETEEKTESRVITPEIKVPKDLLNINKESKEESNKGDELISNEQPETSYIDPVEKIKKSKELLDMGAITSEEFENIKKKYLEQI